MVHHDGGLRHVALRYHNPKLFVQFLDVGINGILAGSTVARRRTSGSEVVWIRQPGTVQQRMTEGAANQSEELPHCLRRTRRGDPPPDCPSPGLPGSRSSAVGSFASPSFGPSFATVTT